MSFSDSLSKTSPTRRAALVGVSALSLSALLAACGSSSPAPGSSGGALSGSGGNAKNPNNYTDDGQNHAGETRYTRYDDSAGIFEPGTLEHPPRNAPKPVTSDAMNENSVSGFYTTIAYFAASMDYLLKMADTAPVSQVSLAAGDGNANTELAEVIKRDIDAGKWYISPSMVFDLSSSQPSIMSDGNLLWRSTVTISYGDQSVVEGAFQEVAAEQRVLSQGCEFRGKYLKDEKKWELNLAYTQASAGASSSAEPGSSTDSSTPVGGATVDPQSVSSATAS